MPSGFCQPTVISEKIPRTVQCITIFTNGCIIVSWWSYLAQSPCIFSLDTTYYLLVSNIMGSVVYNLDLGIQVPGFGSWTPPDYLFLYLFRCCFNKMSFIFHRKQIGNHYLTSLLPFHFVISSPRQLRIDRLLIGTAGQPCFGWVVMLPATTLLWHHNPVHEINFKALFTE